LGAGCRMLGVEAYMASGLTPSSSVSAPPASFARTPAYRAQLSHHSSRVYIITSRV